VTQLLRNSHKVLTEVNYVFINPAQIGKRLYTGLKEAVVQPVNGFRRSQYEVGGLCGGLKKGFVALLTNLASGCTEVVFTVSDSVVQSIDLWAVVDDQDVPTQTIAKTFKVIRSVSGAIVEGANEITVEVLESESNLQRVRTPRQFDARGAIIEYGGGNLPMGSQSLLERKSAVKILRWYRKMKQRKTSKCRLFNLHRDIEEDYIENRSWLNRQFGTFGPGFRRFWRDYKAIYRDSK